jgi:hypothetical protein
MKSKGTVIFQMKKTNDKKYKWEKKIDTDRYSWNNDMTYANKK